MTWMAAIPALPALAFVALTLMPRRARNASLWISIGAIVISAVLSATAFFRMGVGEHELTETLWSISWRLATVDGMGLELGMNVDAIAALLLPMITIVGACVQIYSLDYMRHDIRRGWYFAVLSLFTAAMLALVLASDLLLLFVAWEIMGLCSYLLIGFWFEQEEPRRASLKAFITTRVGDLGFMFALVAIYKVTGTWDMEVVLGSVGAWAPGATTAIAVGLLLAAMGKSAQVPLHVWLPDAMAGPTPASALIHAATMVAAGVYLVARTMPIFVAAPAVLEATLIVGAVTALVGGLLACVQYDIKKVLAYSTISQLGLMFMALGGAGVVAALFHLVTHAFFKSLLFLGAGSIIHATHSQDMREMGGLRRRMPVTWAFVGVGSLALAGVVPLSGFFSKDEIVTSLLHANKPWAAAVVFAASILTAFYMTRLYFRVFEGAEKDAHAREASKTMLLPMSLLVLATLALGWTSPGFARFIGHEGEWPSVALVAASTAVVALGIGAGWWWFGRAGGGMRAIKRRFSRVHIALENKLYFDAAYDAVLVGPFVRLSKALTSFDISAIDGAVNGLATLSRAAGHRLRALQSGRLQSYQRLLLSAVVLFVAYLLVYAAVKGA